MYDPPVGDYLREPPVGDYLWATTIGSPHREPRPQSSFSPGVGAVNFRELSNQPRSWYGRACLWILKRQGIADSR